MTRVSLYNDAKGGDYWIYAYIGVDIIVKGDYFFELLPLFFIMHICHNIKDDQVQMSNVNKYSDV